MILGNTYFIKYGIISCFMHNSKSTDIDLKIIIPYTKQFDWALQLRSPPWTTFSESSKLLQLIVSGHALTAVRGRPHGCHLVFTYTDKCEKKRAHRGRATTTYCCCFLPETLSFGNNDCVSVNQLRDHTSNFTDQGQNQDIYISEYKYQIATANKPVSTIYRNMQDRFLCLCIYELD